MGIARRHPENRPHPESGKGRLAMTEEELQVRRERHDMDMAKLRAATALALRETRFPATVMAAIALALVGPWLLSLMG
jgi:hypothetical protein